MRLSNPSLPKCLPGNLANRLLGQSDPHRPQNQDTLSNCSGPMAWMVKKTLQREAAKREPLDHQNFMCETLCLLSMRCNQAQKKGNRLGFM